MVCKGSKKKRRAVSALPDKLNAQQERFCEEYLVDYNGTKAASRAGYSERSAAVTACRLLKNDKVLVRVRELQAEQAKRLAITADWTLMKLREIVDKAMCAEPVLEYDYDTKQLEPTGEYQFDSRGATKALELIGRHLGMYQDKLEATHVMPKDFVLVIGGDDGDAETDTES